MSDDSRELTEADLCDWTLPSDADSAVAEGMSACVLEREHEGNHVVGQSTRRSAALYEINEAQRTAKTICHARIDRGPFTRMDLAALAALQVYLRKEDDDER